MALTSRSVLFHYVVKNISQNSKIHPVGHLQQLCIHRNIKGSRNFSFCTFLYFSDQDYHRQNREELLAINSSRFGPADGTSTGPAGLNAIFSISGTSDGTHTGPAGWNAILLLELLRQVWTSRLECKILDLPIELLMELPLDLPVGIHLKSQMESSPCPVLAC